MIASTPTKLEVKIRDWLARVEERPEEDRNTIRGLLSQASAKLEITLTEAEQAQLAIVDALSEEEGENVQAEIDEAKEQDKKAEDAEGELVPILTQLLTLFGEESPETKFAAEIAALADTAQDDVKKELKQRVDNYLPATNWAEVEAVLWTAGSTVETLSKQPLGTPNNDNLFQTEAFNNGFVPAISGALQKVSVEEGKSNRRILAAENDAETFALNRRNYIHTRQGAPPKEETSRGTAQATFEALQNMLTAGGRWETLLLPRPPTLP